MALNFNNSPSNGTSENGFTYDSTQGVWNKDQLTTAQQTVVSDTAPTNPKGGDLWWNSTDLKLYIYYNDADSGQWASVRTEGGVGPTGRRSFTNIGSFTSGDYVGELAVANDTKAVYMWDGSAWKRFNVGADEFPNFTTQPSSTIALQPGANSTVTVVAEDPEGFPITYSHMLTPSNPNSVTSITNSGGTFTLVPSSNTAHTDSFVIKFLADDGVHKTVSTSTSVSISHFSGVFGMWADGTVIKAHAGASLATNGTTSESHSTISRSGLQVSGGGDYIQYTGLPDFDFDPGSGENFIVWAMRYPTTLSLGYGMSIRDKNGTTINFINGMQRFQSNVIHEMNMFTSNDGGSSFTNGRGNYPYADLSEYGHPGAGSDYMQDKYIVYAIDSSNASVIWCKEVGGNGLAFQLKPNFSGAGRTQFNSNADNMITFFGGAPHVYTIPGVSGGSGNHSVWKVDVAAVAVYPISFGGGNAVTADFASVIGS